MKTLLRFSLLLFVALQGFGQSIHQLELNAHPDSGQVVHPRQKKPRLTDKTTCTLNKTVFGWHPYWMNGAEVNYEWDLISDFCFFGYEVDATTGNAISTHNFATNDAVDTALVKGKQVHLCVTLFSNHATFFGSTSAQSTLINNLVSLIQSRGAHGINIDFEGVPSAQSTNLTAFMTNLGSALHTVNPNYQLSLCLYAVDWSNVFDELSLNNSVDFYTIMGYDYYYSGSTQAGPTDPLYGFTSSYDYSISRSVSYYLNAGIPTNKLVLGLPYYGREWETSSNSIPSNTTGNNIYSRTYDFVRTNTSGFYVNPITDTRSSSKGYVFQNAGTWRQCWISEENELRDRYDLVNRRKLKGIGIWTLGYDDGYTELWSAIADKLTTCTTWACADTLYDEGGPEVNYYNNELVEYTISPPGATSLNINFLEFSTEANFDTLWIYDGNSTASPLIGFYHGTVGPGQFSTTTGHLTLRFKSDGGTRSSGWKMAYSCVQDNEVPIVSSQINSLWLTQNETVYFTESDNIGVTEHYWNASSLENNVWHSNENTGHAFDEFSFQDTWTSYTGSWNFSTGYVEQTDELLSNTNLALPMPLTSNDAYLFYWKGQIGGAGTNRRAGFHFMCSDLSLPNRGNSYFVWFRVDSDVIQLYEVSNDVFTLTASFPFVIDPNVDYDTKMTFSLLTGEIDLYVNNTFIGTWTDSTPLTVSNGISLRSGNATFKVDEIGVYSGRDTNDWIFVGTNGHFYSCNPSPSSKAGNISNIAIDAAHNIGMSYDLYNVDFTLPLVNLPQEEIPDTDTLLNSSDLLVAALHAQDSNSAILSLYYSVEKMDGTVILIPTSVTASSVVETLNGLVNQENYRIKLLATNGAGLSDSVYSDGFIYINTLSLEAINTERCPIWPNPFKDQFNISTNGEGVITIIDYLGKVIAKEPLFKGNNLISTRNWSAGIYFILIKNEIYRVEKI